ncbi:YhcN/YlaJ family sporulation lipoprotein [Paenibacillus doosanensis]|uniref:Sporulation lipoprotein YhcN/YlaJ (Spore_YhcN_YlaJ) n=1 Tax=Paenibacillus konkukensis TaxID=2020716 RepID=A0ABY4S039_9BACL|nr:MULTISPECIES: YhcN/YlaJ family sporulation lipoprotein [Paenibacillus]MCS7463436.1 YhcN/YlaJ family sporulation lipoprotein [Paenibacillus doosanensis]UQZ87028.1 Sporulation lipoprotein YhcN/YlaJ (Spore_YhcN_YlaJ) [Paenibacillus konkukensis]
MRVFVYCIVLLSVLVGCNQSPKNGASPSPTNDTNRQIQVKQTAPQKKEIIDSRAVSERLEQIATSIPQVESANCVVFGNTAVVGINLPPEMDRSKVGTIKLSVAEALKKDPYGVDAIVTADMDLSHRIQRIRDHVMNGKPISGFATEMAEIIGRIMPQIPRDVEPAPAPESTEPQMPNANL